MTAYYNENDPKAAAWLRELIRHGHISVGEVDERSIEDVCPSDLRAFTQCHFFAGIGGWSYALRLAGWPDDKPVWTGSCPCQPFSAAGKGKGFADERHLWPTWFHLITQCKPERIFGEQVANALGWLDLVSTDLEKESYAVGAAIVGAHSVGAPHIRQRLYWVADAHDFHGRLPIQPWAPQQNCVESVGRSEISELGNAGSERSGRNAGTISGAQSSAQRSVRGESDESVIAESASGVADANGRNANAQREQRSGQHGLIASHSWACEWIACTDGKSRPVEPGTFPLAHGVPGRVGLLRGYGNAIVPQDAAEFISASLDTITD